MERRREIKRGEYGRVSNAPDVSEIRQKTGLSQERFATLLGVSVRTLQDWEQGHRAPSGAARTLLLIAERNPKALLAVACYASEKDEIDKSNNIPFLIIGPNSRHQLKSLYEHLTEKLGEDFDLDMA